MRVLLHRGPKLEGEKRENAEKIEVKILKMMEELGVERTDDPSQCDLAIIIGGDGTLLHIHNDLRCPYIGINPLPRSLHPRGSVGSYMQLAWPNLQPLEKVLKGRFKVGEVARIANDRGLPLALNEVQLFSDPPSDVLRVRIEVCDKSFEVEGSILLVYTPTGATGFARSLDGPLLLGDLFGMVVGAPLSGPRSLAFPNTCPVAIEFLNDVIVSVDSLKKGKEPLARFEGGESIKLFKGRGLKKVIL